MRVIEDYVRSNPNCVFTIHGDNWFSANFKTEECVSNYNTSVDVKGLEKLRAKLGFKVS